MKVFNRIRSAYRKSPEYEKVLPIIERCIFFNDCNLFEFIFYSLNEIKDFLGIKTKLTISSSIPVEHELKGESKIIEICKTLGALEYINPIGGMNLYNKDTFRKNGIDLKFLKTDEFYYKQFNNPFVLFLSIIDVMMFNQKEKIIQYLDLYKLIDI